VRIAYDEGGVRGQTSVNPDVLEQIIPEEAAGRNQIDHSILLHLTALLRSGRQVISDQQDYINEPKAGKALTGTKVVEQVKAKYEEQTGYPVPDLNPASAEGR